MAKAKKTSSGKWRTLVFDYVDEKGKRHYKSFTANTKKESEYLATEYQMNKNDCKEDKGNCTVGQIISEYIDSKRTTLSPTTISGYECSYRNHYKAILDSPINVLTSNILQRWIGDLNQRLSPKTVLNAYGLFHSAIDYANIPFNFKVKLPQKKKDVDIYIPTDSDVKKLIQYFKDQDNKDMLVAVYLAAYGTLRRSEVCGATADDVHGNKLTVNKALVDAHDKGLILKATKNTSSTRVIELPQFVIDELPKSGKLVHIVPRTLTRNFASAVKHLKLPHFRFHDLRHYSASIMHAIGVPDVYIMERGGWSSDKTLKAIYRNSLTDYQRKYTDMTNDYFSKL